MLQSGKRLAHFSGKLGALLADHSFLGVGRQSTAIDSYITMTPSKCYPGIIGPRIEYTTRVRIPNTMNKDENDRGDSPMGISSVDDRRDVSIPNSRQFVRQHHHRSVSEPRFRQKPVCHYNPLVLGYNDDNRTNVSTARAKSGSGGGERRRYLNEFDESQQRHQYTRNQHQRYLFSLSDQQLNEMKSDGCDLTPTP